MELLSIDEEDGLLYSISAAAYNNGKYAFVEDGEALSPRDTTNLNVIPEPPEDLEVLSTVPIGETEATKEVQESILQELNVNMDRPVSCMCTIEALTLGRKPVCQVSVNALDIV